MAAYIIYFLDQVDSFLPKARVQNRSIFADVDLKELPLSWYDPNNVPVEDFSPNGPFNESTKVTGHFTEVAHKIAEHHYQSLVREGLSVEDLAEKFKPHFGTIERTARYVKEDKKFVEYGLNVHQLELLTRTLYQAYADVIKQRAKENGAQKVQVTNI